MRLVHHYLNSLHLFCRLRSMGLSKHSAMRLCLAWERLVHPYIYRAVRPKRAERAKRAA